jgi:hypothetical protein
MIRNILIWAVVSLTIVVAQVNPLLKKGEAISDIGNTGNGQFIEVPLSTVFYAPTMHIIDNIIVYSDRLVTSDDCIIDGLNHEACPLDKKECDANTEYTQGTSAKGEGHISCSQLDNTSYFSDSLNKCVLPASSAKVCKNYAGSHYDSTRDKCVSEENYKPNVLTNTVTAKWWRCHSGCDWTYDNTGPVSGNFIPRMLPVIKAAGGTFLSRTGITYSHDAKVPFTVKAGGASAITIKPSENFTSPDNGRTWKNKQGDTSYSGESKPYIYFSVSTTEPYSPVATDVSVCNDHYLSIFVNYVPSKNTLQLLYINSDPNHVIGSNCSYGTKLKNVIIDFDASKSFTSNISSSGGGCSTKNFFTNFYGLPISSKILSQSEMVDLAYSKNSIYHYSDAYGTPHVSDVSTGYFKFNIALCTAGGAQNPQVSFQKKGCKPGQHEISVNGETLCVKEKLSLPLCDNPYFSEREKNECLGEQKTYSFYNYSCPSDLNVYDNPWNIIDPGGDCGEYSLAVDTDGDGIKDQCNSPTPSSKNCERTVYNCSFNPDAVCILDEKELDYNDFTKWTVENYNNISTASDWEVLNKNSVIQHKNGYPTYFLSNYVLRDGHITMEGTFKTDDPGDNDWFGFVFGFKDRKNYFLLDMSRWKNDNYKANHDAQGNPTGGAIPLTLSKVTNLNSYGPLWSHTDSGDNFKVLQRKDNGGWTSGQEYKIKLDVTRNDIKVWIGKVGQPMTLDINYHSDIALDVTGKLGFYNFSISKVTYKDFKIEWVDGENVTKIFKRPLVNPSTLVGEYKESEYGSLREGMCTDSDKQCLYALSRITATNNKLCLEDKTGRKGCFESLGECTFDGSINDYGIKNAPLYSFLNSPDEVIDGYHANIKKDFNSPTDISLDFTDLPTSNYLLDQVKTNASLGDKITIDFWLYWRGGRGMPIGFNIYDLWITDYLGFFKFGFNTGTGDLYGIRDIDFLKNSWHRITAVFTQGDILQNELYIDGVKQTLSEQHYTRLTHNNARADITKPLQLSGWTISSSYSLDAKIAGLNVYDGRLSLEQIQRLVSGGTIGGISRLKIGKNSISGFDAENTLLGEINSSCELSGKVGFEGKDSKELCAVIRLKPRNFISTKSLGVLYSTGNGNPIGYGNDVIWAGPLPVPPRADLPKHWSRCGYPTSSPLQEIVEVQGDSFENFYLSSDSTEVSFCDGGGSDGNWFVYKNRVLEACSPNERAVTVDGQQYCAYQSFSKGVCETDINNITADMIETTLDAGGVTVNSIYHNVKVANPITAAKVIDNRIEFWNSYENKGNSGHIEIMKKVSDKDSGEGFRHEFEEMTKLYSEGFTAFKTYDNNMTYATSLNPMSSSECQGFLQGTHYSLAERNASDTIGLGAINTFSHYIDGSFGEYCIIQRAGMYDNNHARYAIKDTLLEKVYTAYYCSPWGCSNHKCGYAECPDNFMGTTIQPDDKNRILAETCLDQKCDITKDYFRYCGSPSGCDENDPTVTQTQEGTCKKAACNGEDLFDSSTGQCEKEGCKYMMRGGKCFKKLY